VVRCGGLSRELGRAGEAWEAAETAAGLDSRCVEAYLIQGDLAVADANWRGALQAYQHAEAAAPDDPRVQQGLGTVLSQLEDWDGARNRWRRPTPHGRRIRT